ncbi:putative baseplate assembly protein [Rivularia sp. UHCC 0363]|uniref:putative baseplate assembly protein n=1 Tax=Rivularia sp. UHCC 0363 TaxID=3110244 RepID=UPI002B21172B|nr:putative baseplate assembly protein [Rivularia sp. UHCC 0363]MEA5593272.1 putative baseplate assembly protein [Rivularia sp. UHCC 0363]
MPNSESPKPIYNRPGLPAIVYRIGDYNSFRQRLRSQLSGQLVPGDILSPRPLAKLTTRSNEDPAIALLDAWAVVADVLTFYQERIANEGYLRTATERFSVLELARTIGYEIGPGVAASTYLAFTVDDAPDSVTQAVVHQGTPVMSIPVKDDEVPQTFETSAEILAVLDWNAIKPRLIKPQIISENINQIYLEGTSTQLQPGDWVLLIDNQEQNIETYLLNLTAVEILADNNYTLITWEKQLPDNINSRLRNPQIFAFRNSASLFGKNAPKWEEMPDEIKKAEGGTVVGGVFCSDDNGSNWTPKNKGLPNTDILCLAANPFNKYLFVGTPDRGIFRLQDDGENWEVVNAGLTNLNIQTLYIEPEKGYIFAGTPGGGVFCSKDNGDNWVPIHTGTVRVESRGENNWQSVNTAIPNTVVRSLLTYTIETNRGTGTIESEGNIVRGDGTEFTREFNKGDTITVGNQSKTIVDINSHVSLRVDSAFVPVLASGTSFTTPNRERNYIFAGTDNGVYRSQDIGKNWIPQGLSDGLSDRVIRAFATDDSYIFAGTDNGVYRSQDEGNNWITVNNGELNANTVVYSLTIYQRVGNNCLFAGTNLGVYSSQNPGDSWTIVNNDLPPNTVVYSLATYDEYLFAGTNQGIFSSINNGVSWQEVKGEGLTTKNITSLAVKNHNNNHKLFAGSLFSGFQESNWAGFEVTEPKTDLDALYPKILQDSWIVLLDENLFQAVQVNKLSTASQSKFNLTSEVTRISPSKSVDLSGFRRRNTQVLVQSESLTLAPELLTVKMQQENIFLDPINQNKIYLTKFIPNLQSNKTLIVSGKHIRVIADVGGFFVWNSDESKWERNNQGLTNTSVQALVIDGEFTQYIGTNQGVFSLRNGDNTWEPLKNEALEDTNIQALLIHPQSNQKKAIFAGTPSGIFKYSENNWQAVNEGLTHLNVQALVSYQESKGETVIHSIFAGTVDGGVFVSRNNGDWTSTGLTNVDIQALKVNQDSGDLFAGTFQKGVFHSVNGGNSWEQLTNIERGTGTISSDDIIVQGVGLDLDQLREGDIINAGGQTRTILDIDESTQTLIINTAFRADLPERTAFTINTGLTNLNITSLLIVQSGEENLLFAGTAGSGIFRSENNGKRWKQVNTNLDDLEIRTLAVNYSNQIFAGTGSQGVFRSLNNGELWAAINDGLTNTNVRAIAIFPNSDKMIAGGNGILISENNFYTTPLQKGDLLWVISPPVQEEQYNKWYVRDINNFVGNIIIPINEKLSLQPATDEDGIVSEVCTIKNPPTDQLHPVITLNKPLKYAYDPETVTIYGNVVMATHGESVIEVMGSGDGTIANQSFVLKQPPLTYVSAPTATGAKSTLEVRVNNVLWEQVDTLYQQDTQLQGYIIRLTDDGTPVVTFGDGENGARLPTGEENITAIYRSGIGLEGQVAAESLTQIKDRPLGIVEVTNPLAATGAAPPESRDSAREKAPSKVRTLDRIVSLQDFEDFTRAFAGIGKAQAVPLWNGQSQLVHITVAAADGSPVDENTNLYKQLVAAIDNNRDPMQLVEVDSYGLQFFNLEAKLQFDPRYQEELLIENVTASLKAKFTFVNRSFGQDVTAAEIIATIQQVEGVVAVDLDALYKLGSSKGLQQSLVADLARWDEENNQPQAAQLLLLNPQDIKLTTIPVT